MIANCKLEIAKFKLQDAQATGPRNFHFAISNLQFAIIGFSSRLLLPHPRRLSFIPHARRIQSLMQS